MAVWFLVIAAVIVIGGLSFSWFGMALFYLSAGGLYLLCVLQHQLSLLEGLGAS